MAKHTDGPWEAVSRYVVRSKYSMGDDDCRGWLVAELPSHAADGDSRLIAAAPELLEACKSAEQLMRIAERQARLVEIRGRRDIAGDGRFGIAAKNDPEAKEWQALQFERDTLIALIDAAIAKATDA